MRLSTSGPFYPANAVTGVKRRIAAAVGFPDFDAFAAVLGKREARAGRFRGDRRRLDYDRPGATRHDASISSSERPRVSGTPTMTQTRPITQNTANSQNV